MPSLKPLIMFPVTIIVILGLIYLAWVGAKSKWGKVVISEEAPLYIQKHRFQHVDGYPIDLAFDTWTGQICRTWNWDERVLPESKAYATVVLCSSLPRSTAAPAKH